MSSELGNARKRKLKGHVARTPPAHLVITDTAMLWHSDKALVVSPEFEKVWLELDGIADLTLAIPEVVRGELLFQQTSSARRTVSRLHAEYATLSATTGVSYTFDIPTQNIARNVEERLDAWLVARNASLLRTPIDSINWAELIEAAIWRKPPFTLDRSADVEKGFRDALILETVLSAVRSAEATRVAFICADRLLAETASQCAGESLIVHDSMSSFASYLRLAQETLTDQFVASVVERAAQFFFRKKEENTLYYSEQIKARIEKDFAESLEVNELGAQLLHSFAPDTSPSPWVQMGPQRIRVAKPEFLRIQENYVFHWRSRVTLVRGYSRKRPKTDFAFFLGEYEQNVLILRIDVDWHARVDSQGVFSDGGVGKLSERERDFRAATSDLIRKYDLEGLTVGFFG